MASRRKAHHRERRAAPLAGAAALAALLAGCGGPGRAVRPDPVVATATPPAFLIPIPERTRRRIVATAARVAGRGPGAFEVEGDRFNADCSGFVAAVYEAAGIPFREALALRPEDGGSAVVALYRVLASDGAFFGREMAPLPGDLVFFHDTWDRNGNGRPDDPLTHVGIVEEARPDGTVTFFHRGSKGVARGYLNLARPGVERDRSGAMLNSRLRAARRDDPPGTRYLSGELFATFGRFDAARIAAALEGHHHLSLRALGLDE